MISLSHIVKRLLWKYGKIQVSLGYTQSLPYGDEILLCYHENTHSDSSAGKECVPVLRKLVIINHSICSGELDFWVY